MSKVQPPTGRLGIVHASLQDGSPMTLRLIPQPGGWGCFTPAYRGQTRAAPAIPQPAGWGFFTPAYRPSALYNMHLPIILRMCLSRRSLISNGPTNSTTTSAFELAVVARSSMAAGSYHSLVLWRTSATITTIIFCNTRFIPIISVAS